MIYFNCDYLEGGHPKILEKMLSTNMEQLTGYSTDHYCDSARERIRQACGCPDADVHFLVGGTQTNLTAIASILRPYQGVLAAHDGHIACHETGAIEATGHKVLPIPCVDGKSPQTRSVNLSQPPDQYHAGAHGAAGDGLHLLPDRNRQPLYQEGVAGAERRLP